MGGGHWPCIELEKFVPIIASPPSDSNSLYFNPDQNCRSP